MEERSTLDQVRELRMTSERLLDRFGDPPSRSAARFDEQFYLFLNPDVASAVRQGSLPSGFSHWTRYGWLENRAGGPPEPVADRKLAIPAIERRLPGLNIYGHLSTPSGIGGVARGIATVAEHLGLPVNRVNIPPHWGSFERARHSDSAERSTPFRINLFVLPLNGFESFLRHCGTRLFEGAYNIGFWFWELPTPPPYWRRFYRYFDEIWAASEYCRNVFQCSTNLPVVRIPPLVDGLDTEAIHNRAHFGFADDVFVFTCVFDVGSYVTRKNPFCLIRAFRREFGDSPRVALFLKVWNSQSDRRALRDLECAIEGASNIRIYDGVFTSAEMASLHRESDCLVSPHRSEGFGLNIAEAMYFGRPAIATGYSANLDFMNDQNGYLIDHHLTLLEKSEGPYRKGAVWAEPSEDHLCQLLRRVYENPEERERKGEAARQTIRGNYSVSAVGCAIHERLTQIGLNVSSLSNLVLHRHPEASRMFPASMDGEGFRRVLEVGPGAGISLVMAVGAVVDAASLRASIASVRSQWYPLWDLSIVEDGSAASEVRDLLVSMRGQDHRIKILLGKANAAEKAVEISMYEHLMWLEPGDILEPSALLERVHNPQSLESKLDFYRNERVSSLKD